ncbi:MAG TPA: hypothetical protein VHR72_09400 [Gemmataceae bacterium]|nr:hypothetical protein [Gemmataceae bacterium]
MDTADTRNQWVVYQMKVHGKVNGMNAVCEQQEWDTMERLQPGHHTLVRGGICNEGEAERLARTTGPDGAEIVPNPKKRWGK